jgi:Kdo2-lipid IVA lauroyltransferase/acyltransferase
MNQPVSAQAPTFRLFLDYSLYLVVRGLDALLNLLPERAALATGRFLGRVAYVVLSDRREAVLENLTIAFGKQESSQWIRRTAVKNFEHLGLLVVEFFRVRRWTHQEVVDRLVVEGSAVYNPVAFPGNHGIVILISHFGSFEVLPAFARLAGVTMHLMVTPLRNRFLSQYFFSRGGEDTGMTTVPHRGVVKRLIELLQSGAMVAFLADQRGDAERGVFVDFFGTPAPANEVFARIAMEGKGRVLPLCTYRRDDGRFQVVFEEEIRINPTGDRHQDLVTVSQQFHDVFEKWLRMKPEQGYWIQRKWRRKPSRRRARKATT